MNPVTLTLPDGQEVAGCYKAIGPMVRVTYEGRSKARQISDATAETMALVLRTQRTPLVGHPALHPARVRHPLAVDRPGHRPTS